MFQRLRELLTRTAAITVQSPTLQSMPSTEAFTFESLWDDYERRTWHYDYADATHGASNSRLLNWIGSIAHSGYTREKCLRALISNRQPGDENRILLRLADWVPQVQALARDWVLANFRSLSFDAVCANQRLILYISRKDRVRDDLAMREIESDLLRRTCTISPSQFFGLSAVFRRYLFSLSLASDQQLRPLILDDPDPFNRLLLLTCFEFTSITGDERRRLAADKSAFLRRRFFLNQLESGLPPDRNQLLVLALDSTRSLRQLGQFHLKRDFGEDAYSIYKELIDEKFYFIADFARRKDAEHFLEGVRSGAQLTKYNCLRALASAAPERLIELGLPNLIGQSRKFRAVLLPLLPALLSVDEILTLRPAFEKSSPNGTASFLRILEKKSFWTFVDEGLSVLLTDPGATLRETVVRAIYSKTSIYESLSSGRRESISSKISRLRCHSQKRYKAITDLLEFTMKSSP